MAVRIRKDGRVLCAAMHPAEEGDIYVDDGVHYYLSCEAKVLVTEPHARHKKHGEWWWVTRVPAGVQIEEFYLQPQSKQVVADPAPDMDKPHAFVNGSDTCITDGQSMVAHVPPRPGTEPIRREPKKLSKKAQAIEARRLADVSGQAAGRDDIDYSSDDLPSAR